MTKLKLHSIFGELESQVEIGGIKATQVCQVFIHTMEDEKIDFDLEYKIGRAHV